MAFGWVEAVLLGIVQGTTEWLPVSSKGHLVVTKGLGGIEAPLPYTLLLHFGTLLAVVVAFHADLAAIVRALVHPASWRGGPTAWPPPLREGLAVALATLPIVVVGLLFADLVEAYVESLFWTGVGFLFIGLLLASTAWARASTGEPARLAQALAVGLAQVLALLPGVSRSGMTIAAGMHVGLTRPAAARFSFLLSIPTILGAIVFEARHVEDLGDLPAGPAALGVATSFVVGYATIHALVGFVRRHSLLPFSAYCLALGAGVVWWAW